VATRHQAGRPRRPRVAQRRRLASSSLTERRTVPAHGESVVPRRADCAQLRARCIVHVDGVRGDSRTDA
jgi:hypothetical protein